MNLWDNLTDCIKKSSPLIASAISSTNPIAGMLISLISKTFGANKDDPQDIINKIYGDPEAEIKIKKLEFEHEESLINLQSEDYKTEVDDRKSARNREVSLHDWVPTILAIGFLINYAAIQFYCVLSNNNSNEIISARFQDVLIMIMSYYFGSMHKKNSM